MEVASELIQFNERLAVCTVTLKSENGRVTVYATGLAAESGRYADLAQARALALAHQLLAGGLESVSAESLLANRGSAPVLAAPVLEVARPAPVQPVMQPVREAIPSFDETAGLAAPPAPPSWSEVAAPVTNSHLQGTEPGDDGPLPDIPW